MLAINSLRGKIFALLTGITLLTGVLLVVFVIPVLKSELSEELSEKGSFMAGQLAGLIVDDLLSRNLLQLKVLINEFPLNDDDAVYIYIEGKNHEIIAHTFENGFPSDFEDILLSQNPEDETMFVQLGDFLVHDIRKPIMGGDLGYVHVGLSEEVILERTMKIVWLILLTIIGVLVVAIILAAFFSQKLTEPLKNLVTVSQSVGKGNLEKRALISSNDELGMLGVSFNDMILALQKTTVSKEDYQKQTEFLNEVLAAIPYPFYVINVDDYSIALANPASGSSETLSATTCHALTHRSDIPCGQNGSSCICPLSQVLENGKPVMVEHLHFTKDNEEKHFEVHAYPILNHDGTIVKMIEFSIDITERKLSQKKLDESRVELEKAYKELKATHSQMLQQEKMASIGQLAAGVAHEVNNPMGFITSNLNTLNKYSAKLGAFVKEIAREKQESTTQADENSQNFAEKIKSSKIDFILEDIQDLVAESLEGAERVTSIVQNLKTFAHLNEKIQKTAQINDCIESTLKILWNEVKYKATVVKEYGDLPQTKCFPMELNQVFMNIIINAAQAIEKQGEITIRTWNENNINYISISDNGIGIPEDKISKIFEPFFTTKEIGKGTGLGMSISYDIIKKHNGHILVDSKLGEGTTFTIEIPVVEAVS